MPDFCLFALLPARLYFDFFLNIRERYLLFRNLFWTFSFTYKIVIIRSLISHLHRGGSLKSGININLLTRFPKYSILFSLITVVWPM